MIIPIISPMIADIFRLTWKLIISRLKPIGPVKLFLIIEILGNMSAASVPTAEPKIPPINKKAIKYPIFFRSNVINTI